MNKKKIDKFIIDLIRVCAKHRLILSHDDKNDLIITDISAKLVQDIKSAKKMISGYDENDSVIKNPKKKYKFFKPKEEKD